jgi:DNA-directed RNA polymerase subunit RPC12/RpoP
LRTDAAKDEVLERISKIVGVKVSEDDLTFFQKQALTSIAQTLRQLLIIKQMLMAEQTKQSSFAFRIVKSLRKNKETDEISNYLEQIDELQKLLNTKIEELANNIVEEKRRLIVIDDEPLVKEDANLIQPLKCTNCGAGLKVVSSNLAECEYCGMKYTMANYLSMLKTSIQKT